MKSLNPAKAVELNVESWKVKAAPRSSVFAFSNAQCARNVVTKKLRLSFPLVPATQPRPSSNSTNRPSLFFFLLLLSPDKTIKEDGTTTRSTETDAAAGRDLCARRRSPGPPDRPVPVAARPVDIESRDLDAGDELQAM
jgi:hypothetical protein